MEEILEEQTNLERLKRRIMGLTDLVPVESDSHSDEFVNNTVTSVETTE